MESNRSEIRKSSSRPINKNHLRAIAQLHTKLSDYLTRDDEMDETKEFALDESRSPNSRRDMNPNHHRYSHRGENNSKAKQSLLDSAMNARKTVNDLIDSLVSSEFSNSDPLSVLRQSEKDYQACLCAYLNSYY